MFGVFEGFDAEWDPEEEEWKDGDAEDEKNEEGDVGEEAVDETELCFAVVLTTWTI